MSTVSPSPVPAWRASASAETSARIEASTSASDSPSVPLPAARRVSSSRPGAIAQGFSQRARMRSTAEVS